jgi:hypothetical protein
VLSQRKYYAIKALSIEKVMAEKNLIRSLKNEISIHWEMIRCDAAL